MIKKIVVVLLCGIFLSACEKDDICDGATPTTSQLVLKFYSAGNVIKRVTDLKVIADGLTVGVVLNKSAADDTRFLSNDTIIYIPLKTDVNLTKFKFILNSTSTTLSKTDEIQFNYARENEFVSRACGFKTIFDLNGTPAQPFILNNSNASAGNWIQNIQLLQPIVDNERTTHIKITF
jgi:hypothetical protein